MEIGGGWRLGVGGDWGWVEIGGGWRLGVGELKLVGGG